jgi:hypothetical protein
MLPDREALSSIAGLFSEKKVWADAYALKTGLVSSKN